MKCWGQVLNILFLIVCYASVAQQVEHTAVNRVVGGSSPPRSVVTRPN